MHSIKSQKESLVHSSKIIYLFNDFIRIYLYICTKSQHIYTDISQIRLISHELLPRWNKLWTVLSWMFCLPDWNCQPECWHPWEVLWMQSGQQTLDSVVRKFGHGELISSLQPWLIEDVRWQHHTVYRWSARNRQQWSGGAIWGV